MARDVCAPLTEASSSGVLLAWKCRVGDHVKRGECLAEIETDKANVDLEAPEDGVVLALLVAPGDALTRETVLLRLDSRSLHGQPSDLVRNPVVPVVPIRVVPASPAREERCKFCQTLRVAGRHDCVRCGAPL